MGTTEQDNLQTLAFTQSDERIQELLQRQHELSDLGGLSSLADWDQQTVMPAGAHEVRGHQMATLAGITHKRATDPRLGELLNELRNVVQKPEYTEADRGLVRIALRSYEQATKLPGELVEEAERVQVASIDAWLQAREQKDFALFAPWLTRTIALQREKADRLGYVETRYDALLDGSEPELTASRVEELFAPIREVSTRMLRRIMDSGKTISSETVEGNFSTEKQTQLSETLLKAMGYNFTHGLLARSVHPFTSSFGSPDDVRLTVRFDEQYLPMAMMAALHEGGHALYEQSVSRTFLRTYLASGASMGIHESQSRLWENVIGRSLSYWKGQYAHVQEVFPEKYKSIPVETFTHALNRVEPSLIRVEADEVTYNLHIIIRFEMEKAMVNGDVAVESLPSLWNAKYREYLGIEPENDTVGILQDIHWNSGFGYFPSYTLGNLYSAQIANKIRQSYPDLDERLATGDSSFILNWLREHLYQLGAMYLPADLLQRVTGEAANPQYLVNYLTEKFSAIYGLDAAE